MNIATLITGQFTSFRLEELLESYKEVSHPIIVSTWDHTSERILSTFTDSGFDLVLSKQADVRQPAKGHPSCNYQIKQLRAGIEYIKKTHKVDKLIRMRSDLFCNNYSSFCELIPSGDDLSIMCKILGSGLPKVWYMCDYIFAGSIDVMYNICREDQDDDDSRFPEQFFQEQHAAGFHYLLQDCIDRQIDFQWIRSDRPPRKVVYCFQHAHDKDSLDYGF